MTHQYRALGAFGSLIIVFLALATSVSAATLTNPYKAFVENDSKIQSGDIDARMAGSVEVSGELEATIEATLEGSAVKQGRAGSYYDFIGSLNATIVTPDQTAKLKVDAIQKDEYAYIKIKNADNKGIKNKWIRIHEKDVEEFDDKLGTVGLLTFTTTFSSSARENELREKRRALELKHNLWISNEAPVALKVGKFRTDAYYLEMNRDTAVAYYKELDQLLNGEDEEGTDLNFDGFREGLDSKSYMDRFVSEAWMLVAFDKATGMPVRMATGEEVRDVANDQTTDLFISMDTSKLNKKVKVTAPKKWMTDEEALEKLGLN
ncbi:MAG TPA: hypothetical protein VGB97_00550 [Candidatus Paceibacterota bacterium]|jgi:hypothetical protein